MKLRAALPFPSFRLPPFKYLLGGVLLYLAFLLITAPSYILQWAITKYGQNMLSVGALKGGLWRGEATGLQVNLPNGMRFAFDRAQWRFAPLALLRGQTAVKVTVEGSGMKADGQIGRSWFGPSVHLSDFQATLPGEMLTQVVPMLSIWKPGGNLELKTEDFSLRENQAEGRARLTWKDAHVSLTPLRPLGTYQIALEGVATGVQYQVSTLSGALQVEGKGAWAPNQPPKFLGSAKAVTGKEGELASVLNLMGRNDGTGVYRISTTP